MDALQPWIESLGIVAISLISAKVGIVLAKRPGHAWLWGYFIPMTIITVFGATRVHPELRLLAPWNWITNGRMQFGVVAPTTALLFATLAAKVQKRREKSAMGLLAVMIILTTSIWPFIAPAFNRDFLRKTQTRLDSHGICLQSTDYTCGPAAAVTALRRMGFDAEEGSIAIAAGTSQACGTPPDILAEKLDAIYSGQGLYSRFKVFKSVDELASDGITLAVIKFGFLVDHYVAVLEVQPDYLVVGDPAIGLRKFKRSEFEKDWKKIGVLLRRVPIVSIQH